MDSYNIVCCCLVNPSLCYDVNSCSRQRLVVGVYLIGKSDCLLYILAGEFMLLLVLDNIVL